MANRWLTYYLVLVCAVFFVLNSAKGQAVKPGKKHPLRDWVFDGSSESIKGLGIASYSIYNPEKSWKEALQNGVEDLNANHSLIVYHYGRQVGRGPLRTDSEYAIRSFLDTTQVTVVDSTRWKGRAFVLVEPTTAVPDSVIYPGEGFRKFEKNVSDSIANTSGRWLQTTGSTPRIDSNWHMTFTKAKQKALRELAEYLATKVSTETYQKGATSRRYLNYSTMIAFQRIRTLKRTITSDSAKVEVAIDPKDIKILMED